MENIRDISYGKTFRERFQAIRGETSTKSSRRSAPAPIIPVMYLNLRRKDEPVQTSLFGETPVVSWETVSPSPGESWMRNTGECPSVAVVSSLSSILEENAPEKYYLSAKACGGILNRAERRGKALPPLLWEALIEVLELEA